MNGSVVGRGRIQPSNPPMMNAPADHPPSFDILLDVPVSLTVQLGSCQLPMGEVLQLSPGSVVQLDKAADTFVELHVNHKLVARGEVVVIEDRLGIRITDLVSRSSNHG